MLRASAAARSESLAGGAINAFELRDRLIDIGDRVFRGIHPVRLAGGERADDVRSPYESRG